MSKLRRLLMVRHGETTGNSRERYHGSADLSLSPEGRAQMRAVARSLYGEFFDVIAASPLQRSFEAAWIAGGGAPVRLVSGFREIHFGRWEGLTQEEIAARDPILFEDWQAGAANFEFPNGEPRQKFVDRVLQGLSELQAGDVRSALLVTHKGVIRVIAQSLLDEPLPRPEPAIGAIVELTRDGRGKWFRGRRSSNPEPLNVVTQPGGSLHVGSSLA